MKLKLVVLLLRGLALSRWTGTKADGRLEDNARLKTFRRRRAAGSWKLEAGPEPSQQAWLLANTHANGSGSASGAAGRPRLAQLSLSLFLSDISPSFSWGGHVGTEQL